MNFIDPDDPSSSTPNYGKYSALSGVVQQSPDEEQETARNEAAYKGENLQRIDKELARPGLSQKAKDILLTEKGNLSQAPSPSTFVDPDAPSPAMKGLNNIMGFTPPSSKTAPSEDEPWIKPTVRETLESGIANTFSLWKDESLPAHLYNAQQKGVFNKPIGELFNGAAESVKNFSLSDLWDAAVKDPVKFGKEFVKSVVADPELLLAPMGVGGKLVEAGAKLGGVGKMAGTAAEVGLASAGLEAPVSAAKQLDESGAINPSKLAQDMGVSLGFGAALGGVLSLGAVRAGVRPQELADAAQFHVENGDTPAEAARKVLDVYGVEPKKADALVDTLKDIEKIAPPAEKVPEMTPAQARKDLGQQAAEMKAQRLASEQSESDFANMTEGLQASEAERLRLEREGPSPDLEAPYRNEPLEEATAAQQRIASGEAKGYGEEPSALAARQEALASKKTLTPTEAKELEDIAVYRDVLPQLGAAPEEAAAMTPSQAKAYMKQRGVVDPEMAKWLALGVGGAALGGYLADDKGKGMAIGAALALGGGVALRAGKSVVESLASKVKGIPEKFSILSKRDPEIAAQMDGILSAHEGAVAGTGLGADRLAYTIKKLVPNVERRSELIHAIQDGKAGELQGNERAAAEVYQKSMADLGDTAHRAGVIDSMINDGSYVTQLWKDSEKAKGFYSSVSGTSRFAEDRLIPSYKMGMELGLEPKTLDLAEIARIYSQSIGKSIADKELLQTLKNTVLMDGKPAIIKAENMPQNLLDYTALNHPQFRNLRVNPEIAPSLSHMFYSTNVPAYLQAAAALSSTAKRGIFSLSGFHVKSLLDVGAGLSAGLVSPKALTKIPTMYKMIKEGKAGDFADEMMRAGLKIDPHSGIDMDNDIFRSAVNTAESALKGTGFLGKAAALPLTALKKVDGALQWFLWDYLHPSMKLSAASAMYEKKMLEHSMELAKNPNAKLESPGVVQRQIADTTNDLFGGVNWRRVSDGVQNKFLNEVGNSISNPEGMRLQRILLLAPDWTVATARSGYKGIGATLKGMVPGKALSTSEQMYRRYFLGSALLYATMADALNLHFSGKHFWENDDPTYIDLGDGRRLQLSKHFMEPFHWMQHPGQAMMNKMGYVPKEAMEQMMGKEFITTNGGPPMENPSIPGRLVHAAKGMLPITAQQSSVEGAALGSIGLPIYGKTDDEKRFERRQKQIDRRLQRQSKRDRRY